MSERLVTVSNDSLPYSYISELHHSFGKKIFNPNQDKDATDKLSALRQKWQDEGAITGFSSGVFDLLHMDHMGYLLHVKASAAAVLYEKQNHRKPWNELKLEQQKDYTSKVLGQRAIRLIISVDGDKSVQDRKGNNPEKRGIPTPIYGWETRAMMIAGLSFKDPSDNSSDLLIPTVDAITIHGPQDFNAHSPHYSHFNLVSRLQPDAWTVFGESKDILDEVPFRPNLASIAFRCIQDGTGTHYFEDSNIGKMSTTKIAKRIIGG